ncbi:single-stranded-DNA-specific exonuclease RecJ [Hyphomonas sp. FCG-A18]|uniref:single-stranded-DNA-specific exonuclease RecJ n=1 Tax=Hyphomonas sp. FCG-A18 TaxID=3080019 RepID=UPI002B30B82D|nr:single-stranded-DNA-specific exonuclease RecJ [Hyphomonas sp. FCG-A18]
MPYETASTPFVPVSHGGRFWTLRQPDEAAVRALTPHLQGEDLLARLLTTRGIAPEEVETFLNPTLRALFPDPASFQDMMKAAGLVLDALVDGRNVTVFADYDVDGGTSSAILARYFRAWGREIGLYVPDRLTEGYGPSPAAFRHLKEIGSDLVITVDCGAAAVDALAEAEAIGLPVIVIDHHLMGKTPPACAALVNPNRADDESGQGHLAAAGVVYVFAAALNKLARERGIAPEGGLPNILEWLDLCALGTLCDMSPLKGANRAFVKQGLKVLSAGQNTGLRALADVAGIGTIETVYHATFVLGPRLNAGGRVGDPWLAAKLLATDDRSEALALAERLHGLNDERKAVENAILEQASVEAQKTLDANPDAGVLIAAGEGWHPGVIGIVAGRLKDRFHLPAIVIGWGEGLGPVAKGSARSVHGVNIGDAIAAAAKDGVILSGGGHAMAGGLSLEPEQLPALRDWMDAHMAEFAQERAAAKELTIDALLATSQVRPDLYDAIGTLGPFGQGAPEPIFALKDVEITHTRPIGENHLKLTVEDAGGRVEALVWRCMGTPLGDALMQRGRVHLAGKLKDNEWNGRRTAQFDVIDAAPAD